MIAKAGDMAAQELSLAMVAEPSSSAPDISASCCWGQGCKEMSGVDGQMMLDVLLQLRKFPRLLERRWRSCVLGASGWCEFPSLGGFSPSHACHSLD